MKIKCQIVPITIVRVTINDEFCSEIPIPNAAMEDPDYDYESEAIEIAKDEYKYHTELREDEHE